MLTLSPSGSSYSHVVLTGQSFLCTTLCGLRCLWYTGTALDSPELEQEAQGILRQESRGVHLRWSPGVGAVTSTLGGEISLGSSAKGPECSSRL